MNKLLKEILQDSKDNQKIIGVRLYNQDDTIYAGYISDFNDDMIIIQHFTEYGKNDGLVLERIDKIENIEVDDDYYKSLQYLIQINNQLDIPCFTDTSFELGVNWRYENLKKFVDKEVIIIIENSKNEKICGFVKRLTKEVLIFNSIGKLGQDEGLSYYKMKDICSIQPDDLECRKRLFLYKWKTNK